MSDTHLKTQNKSTGDVSEALTSIVIVSYNTRELTCQCIESVYKQTAAPFEIIVVDNASKDGSAERIQEQFPDVKVVALKDNIGFGRGCNAGAKEAKGDYICLLNPDAALKTDAITALVAFATRRPGGGIWGGRSIHNDGSLDPKSCWGLPSLWSTFCFATGLSSAFSGSKAFDPESMGTWDRDSEREVGLVTGYLLLIKRELWDRLGGFDERFFMYGEDADLAIRARQLGYRPAITPEAVVTHVGGAASSTNSAKTSLLMKGKATIIHKHFAGPKKQLGLGLLVGGVGLRAAGDVARARIKGGKPSTAWVDMWAQRKAWLKGY